MFYPVHLPITDEGVEIMCDGVISVVLCDFTMTLPCLSGTSEGKNEPLELLISLICIKHTCEC